MTQEKSFNGYQIRLELLKMAKELLEQEWLSHRDAAMSDYHTKVAIANMKADASSESVPTVPVFKPFPTEAEIITKARALNDFICQKN